MHASRNIFTATEIQHDGKRLVFPEPVQMKLVFSKGSIAIECELGRHGKWTRFLISMGKPLR